MTTHPTAVCKVPQQQNTRSLTPPCPQAKALHLASRLETRCAVHRVVYEQLIQRVGAEGAGHAAAWSGATTIINTNSAAGGAAAVNSSTAAHATATAASPSGGAGPIQVLLLGVVAVAGGAVRFVVALLVAAGGAVVKLLALGSFLAAARAMVALKGAAAATVASGRGRQPAASQMPVLEPMLAAAGWPTVRLPHTEQAPDRPLLAHQPTARAAPQGMFAGSTMPLPGGLPAATVPSATSNAPVAPAAASIPAPSTFSSALRGLLQPAHLSQQHVRAFGYGMEDDDGW